MKTLLWLSLLLPALAFAQSSNTYIPGPPYSPTGTPTNGQCLTWNNTTKKYTNTSCGSGSGGTVTSLTAGSGLTATPSPITATGSFSLDLTSANIFSGAQTFTGNQYWKQVGAGTDLGVWGCSAAAGTLTCSTFTDALGAGRAFMTFTRGATVAISSVTFGNATDATAWTFLGGGLTVAGVTSSGSISTPRIIVNGSTPATVGAYLPAANTLGLSTASGLRVSIGATGIVTYTSGQVDQIRVITASGAITAATTDRHVCVNKTTGAASAVALFATPTTGTVITVDDCKGDAATNNITITPAAGNIDGSATFVITTNFGSWTGIYTGTIWKTEASR